MKLYTLMHLSVFIVWISMKVYTKKFSISDTIEGRHLAFCCKYSRGIPCRVPL